MTDATGPTLRIGYCLAGKKQKNLQGLLDSLSQPGVSLIPIDADHLDPNISVDVVLQKVTDWMVRSDDAECQRRVRALDTFFRDRPDICLIEPIEKVADVIDRVKIASIINHGNIRTATSEVVRCPESCVVDFASAASLARLDDFPFPAICKTIVACGSPESHRMALVPSKEALLRDLPAGTWLVQQFVDHSGLLFKIYVMGELVQIVPTASLPNFAQWNTQDISFIDSQTSPSKQPISVSASAGSTSISADSNAVSAHPIVQQELAELVARQLGRQCGFGLFGFDLLVQDQTNSLFIVDINYFPSFKALPNFGAELLSYIRKRHAAHAHMRSVLPKELSLRSDWITIIGYGSLLSESSSRRSFPNLRNFRVGHLRGFRRVFNLVSVSLLRHKKVDALSNELASVAARRLTAEEALRSPAMVVTAFEVPRSELPSYFEREDRYSYCTAPFVLGFGADCVCCAPTTSACCDDSATPPCLCVSFAKCCSLPATVPDDAKSADTSCCSGLLCTEFSDEAYRKRCGDDTAYFEKVGRWYDGKLWRQDILPGRLYLAFVLQAAYDLGPDCFENFLDTSFLADGTTSLRSYLSSAERVELLPAQLREMAENALDKAAASGGAAGGSAIRAARDPHDVYFFSKLLSPTSQHKRPQQN